MPRSKSPADGLVDTWGRANRRLADRACAACATTFRPARSSSRFCSRPCARTISGGHNRKPETWWVNGRGYIEGRIWIDGAQRRVKQHRWVMEMTLGRALRPDEDVHHLDGNKQNNSPENLQVISHHEHSRITNGERTYRRGYSLSLSEQERAARAERMRAARAAISKATASNPPTTPPTEQDHGG